MPEPVYRWQPVTDLYKEEAVKAADIEAANQQVRQELIEEKAKQHDPVKKAPIGIRIFTWYCFSRAGVTPSCCWFSLPVPARNSPCGCLTV